MKNLLFGSLTSVLFSFNGNAQDDFKSVTGEKTELAYICVKHDDEVVKYKFSTFKDLVENSDKILEDMHPKSDDGKEYSCIVTVEISVSFSQGIESSTVTGTTKSSCQTIVETAKKLISQLNTINM
jgi:hypothetical protein